MYIGQRYLSHSQAFSYYSRSNCRTQFLAQISSSFQASRVTRCVPWSPLPLCADLSVVLSAVMNAVVVCWREEHHVGPSTPPFPAITTSSPPKPEAEAQSLCRPIGPPQRSFQHWRVRVDGLLSGRLSVYCNLQYFSVSSVVQISCIYLLTRAVS